MIVDYCEQGSDEWKLKKLGIPSSSNFDKIITSTGKASTQRKAYMNRLLAEYLTGTPTEGYKGEWMERGLILESGSRSLYEFIKGTEIKQVGLVYKDKLKLISCSPDGLLGYDIVTDSFKHGYETKCPAPHTHIEYLLAQKLPAKYKAQVQGSMYVTGMDHWDFMSYHPDMKPLIIRVDRDERYIKLLADELELFVSEMLALRIKLEALK